MADIEKILPVYRVEHDAILSMQGDITIAYEVILPEIFTLSDRDYEAFHQILIKAIKILPKHTILHKQDWFIEETYKADYFKADKSFLSTASERFFHKRAFLDHRCYILLTKKPQDRRPASSIFSNLLRRSIVPSQTIRPGLFTDFLDHAGQFERILKDSGLIGLRRLSDDELAGTAGRPGIIEQYLFPAESK